MGSAWLNFSIIVPETAFAATDLGLISFLRAILDPRMWRGAAWGLGPPGPQPRAALVQNGQRLMDASWAGSSTCQTLQIPLLPWQPLKF